ncbi:MAG: ATP-dependent helicase [Corynebacterium sp.]|nr:ATP-dependent helicase [Corynebacterium sp.]
MSETILSRFHPQVAAWFTDVFAAPTAVQAAAWTRIAAGDNALVVAPTGSGKTLAAFLWAINSLVDRPPTRGVKVLYISPLKALGVDVQENLRAPLTGIARMSEQLELTAPTVTVGVRSGDTPAAERARQSRMPPDILITTPESLYLILTSQAAEILTSVETVIIDEIHAVAPTKRGVHLALSLERLDALVGHPIQRIGLSATVRPLERMAAYLGGSHPAAIIAPPAEKQWNLAIHVPVEDMANLADAAASAEIATFTDYSADDALSAGTSIWPFLERDLYTEVMSHTSTLIFVNSRRLAERVTSRLNELYAADHDPDALATPTRRPPAQVMAASAVAGGAPPLIARAHHGSVSKEERRHTEEALKAGTLRAVVATSSLELGIDMGAVDLVVQIEAPPSVASGLQRVGRAGHAVGAVSTGSFYPKHRADLLHTTVTVERMRAGAIEELTIPTNALDVLTQQTIAQVARADITTDAWFDIVTRAYPYRHLDRTVFDAVIDLTCGAYPSTDFADLKPRLTLDVRTGTLSARPSARRIAVTSGGTIPDRGMFGVFLLGGEGQPRRVGELDEEMVYESRVGDVFTLGASSWRIEDITRDQVIVSPAPGHTGRLPFWNGGVASRPAELGAAIGAFSREITAGADSAAGQVRLEAIGLDRRAVTNLQGYLAEQAAAVGLVPDEKTLLLERFRDELGDWRVVLHSPYGRGVNAAWALAVGARITEETGMDAQAVAGDDGIVLRLPATDSGEDEPGGLVEPSASLFLFRPEEMEDLITRRVGDSALFASRFRECAARALLLPRKDPGKRAPLWQQRQRAEQLLAVAKRYPSFPIILETVRECLHDVYDLPTLLQLQRDVANRSVRIAEVTTSHPSPFAATVLFNYTGAFMYNGDTPAAERRAAALALDPSLLAKLLGTVSLKQLLDEDVIAQVTAEVGRIGMAGDPEQLFDTLRMVGPIPVEELDRYVSFADPLESTLTALGNRVIEVRFAGVSHLAASLDMALLRDGLGVPVPPGIAVRPDPIADAVDQLIRRWVRTHGPFTVADIVAAFGLGSSVVDLVVAALVSDRTVTVIAEDTGGKGSSPVREYCATGVLRTLRARSLAAARSAAQPVSQRAFARFLTEWHHVAPVGERPPLHGVDGVFEVIEQLAGVRLTPADWEERVLPARVADYSPQLVDSLTETGEVVILGAGAGTVLLLPTDYAAQLAPPRSDTPLSDLQQRIVELVSSASGHAGFFFADLDAALPAVSVEQLRQSLRELVDMGYISPDTLGPFRYESGRGRTSRRTTTPRRSRSRRRLGRTRFTQPDRTPPDMRGRWALAVPPATEPTARAVAHGEAWLDRYGVVTRGSVAAEDVVGGFALAYQVLSGFEENGQAMRGYLVEDLGAAQFSLSAIVDRLRGFAVDPPSGEANTYVLAATDPANPYGAALPWPEGMRVARTAGSLVIIDDGELLAHLTRGGKSLTLAPGHAAVDRVVAALSHLAEQTGERLVIEKIGGEPALTSPLRSAFQEAGAAITPKGVVIRAGR